MAKGTLADMPPNIWKFAFHAELAVLHVNGSALNKDGSQDHCAKDASEVKNGGVASHRCKYRLDPDIDYCGGRFDCLLGEQAIKAYPARKVS